MTKKERQTAEFKARVKAWTTRLRVQPSQIRVQEMRRKWASCSSAGWVSFAYDLLHEPRGFQEEVIVHELLHLRYPNHGKLFRAAFRSYLANAGNAGVNEKLSVSRSRR
jgi:predicted metal-dependent hydrolase